MKKLRLLKYIMFASLLIVTFVPSPFSADMIKIGVIGPMKYVQGEHHWNGATLAMEETKYCGGSLSLSLRQIYTDCITSLCALK